LCLAPLGRSLGRSWEGGNPGLQKWPLMRLCRGTQSYVTAFRGALTKLGWAEGGNLRIDVRWGAGDAGKIQSFAKELVDLRPDAIVGQSTPVVVALARLTQTIPIVFVNVADPIGSGLVASLARPGDNLTGFTTDNSALGGKWVELLKEIVPRTKRVALMFNPNDRRTAKVLYAIRSGSRVSFKP